MCGTETYCAPCERAARKLRIKIEDAMGNRKQPTPPPVERRTPNVTTKELAQRAHVLWRDVYHFRRDYEDRTLNQTQVDEIREAVTSLRDAATMLDELHQRDLEL